MKFQILSVFWGEQHKNWFRDGCLKSLTWPKNKKAILDNCSTWNIHTEEKYFPEIMELAEAHFPSVKIKLGDTNNLRRYIDNLQSALVMQIFSCLADKERFLFAPPDTIFADGTIDNILKAGQKEHSCVAVAHARVLPQILSEIKIEEPLKSQSLVSLAFKNLHQSWYDAEEGHPRQNSFIGGVRWKKTKDNPNTYSVIHHLPTTYLADFTPQDLTYFQTCNSFGNWDHTWATMLYQQGRQVYVKSSDECFIVELTNRLSNIPPVRPGDTNSFWKQDLHNQINAKEEITFTGEK